MAGEFFVRFNLHNSVCCYPASFDILRPMVGDMSDAELRAFLDKIENVHAQRAAELKKAYEREINVIRGKKVLFLGDSLTSDNFGYRRTVTRAAELNALDGSVSGGTSSALLHSAKMQLQSFKPDIVSIMIGTNDSVCIESDNLPQVGTEEYGRNVKAIVEWSLNIGAHVLLFEIPPVHEERFSKSFTSQYKLQSNGNIATYNSVLKNIADECGIPLLSNAWIADGDKNSLFEPDGIHLSLEGQELFARNWITAVAKIINGKDKNL